jgi:hypothetical protein
MSAPRFRYSLVLPVLLSLALTAPPVLGALPQRTFVASYGVDSNPCSLALPCRSFNVAIPAVTPGGEVIVLDSAAYGPTAITQSVSLIAPAGVYAGVSVIPPTNTVGVTINGAGIKVVLQNIAINALGGTYGIQVLQAAEVDVNGCTVSNFVGAGIYSTAAGAKLNVRDTLVRDNNGPGAIGVWLAASMRAVLDHVRVVRNNADGIRVEAAADASVKRSVVAGNGSSGIFVSAAAAIVSAVTVEDSLLADNGDDGLTTSATGAGAVAEASAARNTITRNAVYGVGVNAATSGSSIVSLTDNLISQQSLDGVWATGAGAVVTAGNNTFAGNGTSALHALAGATIHTVTGADGLPNNSGEQTTPTIGNVVPSSPF